MKDQNEAIDQQIEVVKAARNNFERKPGEYQDTLKAQPRAELKSLREKKAANVKAIAELP